jgi:hypothetical protein
MSPSVPPMSPSVSPVGRQEPGHGERERQILLVRWRTALSGTKLTPPGDLARMGYD